MAHDKNSNRPVALKPMTLDGFMSGFYKLEQAQREGRKPGAGDMERSLDIPLFTGDVPFLSGSGFAYDVREHVNGTVSVDFASMCVMDPDLLECMGVPREDLAGIARGGPFSGNTADVEPVLDENGNELPDGPVGIHMRLDIGETDFYKRLKLRPVVDVRALADASASLEGREPDGRMAVDIPFHMHGKNGALEPGGLAQRQGLCRCLAADYLLNADRSRPDDGKPSKESIGRVADLYERSFTGFVDRYLHKDCPGVPSPDGNGTVPGTAFPALGRMGIGKSVDRDGKMSVCFNDAEAKLSNVSRDVFQRIARVFNAEFQAEADKTFEAGSMERSIAGKISAGMYAGTLRDKDGRPCRGEKPVIADMEYDPMSGGYMAMRALKKVDNRYLALEPSVTATATAERLNQSAKTALHQTQSDIHARKAGLGDPEARSRLESEWGREVLQNASEIAHFFDPEQPVPQKALSPMDRLRQEAGRSADDGIGGNNGPKGPGE